MNSQFKVLSLSYKKAPLEIRERLAFDEAGCKALMTQAQDQLELTEVMVLSTCNRTEVYFSGTIEQGESLVKLLSIAKGVQAAQVLPYFDWITDSTEAVRYLFEVALGLHSQVIGDLQIPNQIKHAYQWSADVNMAGPFLHRLMHSIFFANKRIVQETAYRDGAASTSYAAVETIETFMPLLHQPKTLVIGLGEIGEDVCKTLAEKGYTDITLTNRTSEKAQKAAELYGFQTLPFDQVFDAIHSADIIISSIRAEQPLVTPDMLEQRAIGRVKYFIDLSVPRSISPAVQEVPGVVVYDLDEIQQRANAALEKRLAAIPSVHAIINEVVSDFHDWSREMIVSPTIQKLKQALEQIRKEEMARHLKHMSEEEAQKVDKITSSMMQKIIKLPVLQLKAACKRGEAETLIDVLNDLFNLENVPTH